MTSTYVQSGGCDLSKPSPDDDPLSDLKLLEENMKDGVKRTILLNLPLIQSLKRDNVEVDVDRSLDNINDQMDDELYFHINKLERQ